MSLPPEGASPPTTLKAHNWATYIPGRSPKFKTHAHQGQARTALSYVLRIQPRGGVLYERNGDEWVERFRFEPHTVCAHCAQELGAYQVRDYQYHQHGAQTIFDAAVVCKSCDENHFRHWGNVPQPLPWSILYNNGKVIVWEKLDASSTNPDTPQGEVSEPQNM